MILNKIASDAIKKFDLDEDFHMFMVKVKNEYDSHENWNGKVVKGFIQGYTIYPSFSVTLFCEEQIRLIVDIMKSGYLCLHLNATESIFSQPPDSVKRVFYYCLVISGDKNSVPIAPLEFITCGHDVYIIQHCLDTLVSSLQQITSTRPLVSQIETDFSKALLQADCKAFNNMDITVYLHHMWDRIHNQNHDYYPITILHVCSSHLIKSAIHRIKTFTSDEHVRTLLKSAIGLLIHRTDLADAVSLFQTICILFGCPKKCVNYETFLQELADIATLEYSLANNKTVSHESDDAYPLGKSNTQRQQSRFYTLFSVKYKEVLEMSDFESMENNLYLPAFIMYLIDELLPYYPLWSGIVIKDFGIRRHSNAAVENWNKIIKYYLFDGVMRQLIPRAVRTLAKNVQNRLAQRKYDTLTTRQVKNRNAAKAFMAEECNVAIKITKRSLKRKICVEETPKIHTHNLLSQNSKRVKALQASDKIKKIDVNDQDSDETEYDLSTENWCRRTKSNPPMSASPIFKKVSKNGKAMSMRM